jgi:hypothetical protein
VDWIDLAQDRDKWCAPVKAVMKVSVPKMLTISSLPEDYCSKRTLFHGVSTTYAGLSATQSVSQSVGN